MLSPITSGQQHFYFHFCVLLYFSTINIYYYNQKIYHETLKIQIKDLSTCKITLGKWHKTLLSSKKNAHRTYQQIRKAQTSKKNSQRKVPQKLINMERCPITLVIEEHKINYFILIYIVNFHKWECLMLKRDTVNWATVPAVINSFGK